jgi:hypothetical protein
MWARRLAFPTFVFFLLGFVAVLLAWAAGLLGDVFQ